MPYWGMAAGLRWASKAYPKAIGASICLEAGRYGGRSGSSFSPITAISEKGAEGNSEVYSSYSIDTKSAEGDDALLTGA